MVNILGSKEFFCGNRNEQPFIMLRVNFFFVRRRRRSVRAILFVLSLWILGTFHFTFNFSLLVGPFVGLMQRKKTKQIKTPTITKLFIFSVHISHAVEHITRSKLARHRNGISKFSSEPHEIEKIQTKFSGFQAYVQMRQTNKK